MKKTYKFLAGMVVASFLVASCGGNGGEENKGSDNNEAEEITASSIEVTIGKQVWMTENLNVDKFRNGDPILEAKSEAEWEDARKSGQPAWRYYNNSSENGDIYGKLYNWHAVNDPRGLAPEGYKIPTVGDWSRLIDFLGGEGVAGNKMKSTEHWIEDYGSNESGFSGLPGGDLYISSPGCDGIGKYGSWWSSTENSEYAKVAWGVKLMTSKSENLKVDDETKDCGRSVRCIKAN